MSEKSKNRATEKTCQELEKLNINTPENYLDELYKLMKNICVTKRFFYDNEFLNLSDGIGQTTGVLKDTLIKNKRLMIIGNGGSAAIAAHMSMDYVNVGGIRTMDFTSPPLLSCMANDYGWENVFAKPIQRFADKDDVLFAISSSGQSENILNACNEAIIKSCLIITFSGMDENNWLRGMGQLNFYVPSTHYGFIELAHETLLHAILDLFVKSI